MTKQIVIIYDTNGNDFTPLILLVEFKEYRIAHNMTGRNLIALVLTSASATSSSV